MIYRESAKPKRKTRLLCRCLLPLFVWNRIAKPTDFDFTITGRERGPRDTKPYVYGRVYVRCNLCNRVWVRTKENGRLCQVDENEASSVGI